MRVNIPWNSIFPGILEVLVASVLRQGKFNVPHQAASFTISESHHGGERDDKYLNREKVLNYETALLECASGSQSAVGEIYEKGTNYAPWRTGSCTTCLVRRTSSTMLSRRFSGMPKTSILHGD